MDGHRIKELFSSIAEKYDLLNHVLSFNIDRFWRKKLVKLSGAGEEDYILDICTGTGDIAIEFARKKVLTTGLDFSRKMLSLALKKAKKKNLDGKIRFIEANAIKLPLKPGSFSIITMGFGLRNIESQEKALREIYRVLKKGGKVLILEFVRPENSFSGKLYNLYLAKVVPVIGGIISGKKDSYKHLSSSVKEFHTPEKLIALMKDTGFVRVTAHKLTIGIAYIFIGEKL